VASTILNWKERTAGASGPLCSPKNVRPQASTRSEDGCWSRRHRGLRTACPEREVEKGDPRRRRAQRPPFLPLRVRTYPASSSLTIRAPASSGLFVLTVFAPRRPPPGRASSRRGPKAHGRCAYAQRITTYCLFRRAHRSSLYETLYSFITPPSSMQGSRCHRLAQNYLRRSAPPPAANVSVIASLIKCANKLVLKGLRSLRSSL
jgi:hypothetical protein